MNELTVKKSDTWERYLVCLAWILMMIFAFHASTHMVGAGDTWVAMACGRHFMDQGIATDVITVEPFSANSHKAGPTEKDILTWPEPAKWIVDKVGLDTVKYWHPTGWINQNWLTHVIFYWLTHDSPVADADNYSYNTLVYWKIALYIVSVICIYYTARILGAHYTLAAVFACFAVFVGRSFLDIRPAGFSNMLTSVFILILVLATYRNVLYLWLIVPLTVFWCNVHGGYIYVFIILVPFVVLHFLILTPKRWTVFFCSAMTWTLLYLLTYRFVSYHPTYFPEKPFIDTMPLLNNGIFYSLIFLILAGLALTLSRKVNNGIFYSYLCTVSVILVFVLFSKFYPNIRQFYAFGDPLALINKYIGSQHIFFWLTFFAAIAVSTLVTFFKDKLVSITPAGLSHAVGVGFAAFFAMIIFNPFHLTNITHTFIISVSRHAELWKNVNEWHRAFEWSNPVGTSFPFLVMYILAIGLFIFWIYCRFLIPKSAKPVRGHINDQKKKFSLMYTIFGAAAAVMTAWIVFIGFSFMDLHSVSFALCAFFILIILFSILKSIHFIYLFLPLALLAQAAAGDPLFTKGGYYYPLLLIPAYLVTYITCSVFSSSVKFKRTDILLVAATAAVSLYVLVIAFNPFKLNFPKNGVADFGQWLNAWKPILTIKRPWYPVYEGYSAVDGVAPLSYKYLFPVLYIINFFAVVVGFALPELKEVLKRTFEDEPVHITGDKDQTSEYRIPNINLVLILIAALTVYMAVSSRRFIPVAAFVACPVLAMFADQIIRTLAAAWNYLKNNRFTQIPFPHSLGVFLVFTAAAAVIGLGSFWGWKFKCVYLDPWPTSYKYTSVFMRMTASYQKPFEACSFIRNNKLKGNMFNYWTEGGFIAYGQDPDPNTGKTPLRLFMDGRAQAAYEPEKFTEWTDIMAGGDVVRNAKLRNSKLSQNEYEEVGKCLNQVLKDKNVWIVLMPSNQFNTEFMIALENYTDNWKPVYMDSEQKILVDLGTQRGMELFKNTFRLDDGNFYPDKFSGSIIFAHNQLRFNSDEQAKKKAVEQAGLALNIEPSQFSIREVLLAAQIPFLKKDVDRIVSKYLEDFLTNQETYSKQNGYHSRIVAAILASSYLSYDDKVQEDLKITQQELIKGKSW